MVKITPSFAKLTVTSGT